MKKIKISCFINYIIFLLVLIGVIFMFCNINFMGDNNILSISGVELFKFFTVDSNIFMGISALLFGIYEILIIKKKKKNIPHFLYTLKFMATISITLTFLVTAFFLVPTSKYPYWIYYQNSNLFFHLIVPILSIITFILYEKNRILTIKDTFISMIPVILYSIFYISNILIHITDDYVLSNYDFYGFLRGGYDTIFLVILLVFVITYGISLILLVFNRNDKKSI